MEPASSAGRRCGAQRVTLRRIRSASPCRPLDDRPIREAQHDEAQCGEVDVAVRSRSNSGDHGRGSPTHRIPGPAGCRSRGSRPRGRRAAGGTRPAGGGGARATCASPAPTRCRPASRPGPTRRGRRERRDARTSGPSMALDRRDERGRRCHPGRHDVPDGARHRGRIDGTEIAQRAQDVGGPDPGLRRRVQIEQVPRPVGVHADERRLACPAWGQDQVDQLIVRRPRDSPQPCRRTMRGQRTTAGGEHCGVDRLDGGLLGTEHAAHTGMDGLQLTVFDGAVPGPDRDADLPGRPSRDESVMGAGVGVERAMLMPPWVLRRRRSGTDFPFGPLGAPMAAWELCTTGWRRSWLRSWSSGTTVARSRCRRPRPRRARRPRPPRRRPRVLSLRRARRWPLRRGRRPADAGTAAYGSRRCRRGRAAPATYREPAARTASSPSVPRIARAQASATVSAASTSSQPRATAARATSCDRHAARRRGRAGDDDVELVGPQRLEHRRRLAQRADDEDAPAVGVEVVEEHLGARVGAGRVVGAVDDDQRLVAEHLEATRHRRRRRSPPSTTSSASGAAKNASTAVRASEALSPWWAPCSGTNTSE